MKPALKILLARILVLPLMGCVQALPINAETANTPKETISAAETPPKVITQASHLEISASEISASEISDSEVTAQNPTADPHTLQPVPVADFFGASPEAIATLLGPPVPSPYSYGSDTRHYNPESFAPHFPETTFKYLSVRFENNQASSVHLLLELPMPTIQGPGSLPEDEAAALELNTTFFQALFQDPAPTYTPLAQTHPSMSLQVSEYCSAQGISTSLIDGQLYDLNFSSDPACP